MTARDPARAVLSAVAEQAGYSSNHPPPLSVWPIATKDLFRANPDAFQSEAFSRKEMSLQKTSGRSGELFQFRVHRSATDYSYACLWRALSKGTLKFMAPCNRRCTRKIMFSEGFNECIFVFDKPLLASFGGCVRVGIA